MPSMSYCKFENTLNEMSQCVEAMGEAVDIDELDMNQYEQPCFDQLAKMCRWYLEEYDRLKSVEEELE
jgi:hypothetical protein